MHADRLIASVNRQAGLLVTAASTRGHRQAGFWCLLIYLLLLPMVVHAAPAGTIISNTATATFNGGVTSTSNTVNTVTVTVNTPSTLEFLQYAPGSATAQAVPVAITDYSTSATTSGPFVAMTAPTPAGSTTPIDLSKPVPLQPATVYHQGDPIFVRLTDSDQNHNATVADTVMVKLSVSATGDTEVLRLTETGPNTGVFTGYIQSYIGSSNPTAASPGNGELGLRQNTTIAGYYVDPTDPTDTSTATAAVDPLSLIFDSATGQGINGAQVTLINATTNQPATVYGDDGVSTFPATITSGGSATDSSGKVYNFTSGHYRFPFVKPGSYRLQVTPPAGYSAPSKVSPAVLQTLPGAPFAINAQASYDQAFAVSGSQAIHVDIPVDDPGGSGLFLSEEASKQVVAVGDFLSYRLHLTNTSGATANSARIVDSLPLGLRYQPGSATLNGKPVADPVISADGRTLTFNLNNLANGASVEVDYVAQLTIAANGRYVINRAIANANAGALVSNQSSASVRIIHDLLHNHNVLMGRVVVGGCGPDSDKGKGLAGVRIYLEDGTYAVTDAQGMYHFEGVKPGSHVVQMDLESLGSHYKPIICGEQSRFAGRGFSRFVDLQGGTLWRTDFHVKALPPPKGIVGLKMHSRVDGDLATYHLAMKGGNVALNNMRLMIDLPAGVHYIPGSSVLDNKAIADPEIHGPVLIYRLGKVSAAWKKRLNFLARVKDRGATVLLTSRALLMFNSPGKNDQRTPTVSTVIKRLRHEKYVRGKVSPHFTSMGVRLSAQDKAELKQLAVHLRGHKVVRIEAFGHTDNVPISARATSRFADNFVLSVERAKSVADYLAGLLKLPESAVIVHGMGATQPYVPNKTSFGRAENRRVDLHIVTETLLDSSQISGITAKSKINIEVDGKWKHRPSMDRKTSSKEVRLLTMPKYDKDWVDGAKPGLELLWPKPDYNPPIPSIKIAVKHAPDQRLTVLLNGEPVSSLNYVGEIKNGRDTVAVSEWAGVDIEKGDNTLVVEVRDLKGKLIRRLQREVHMSSRPVRAELVRSQSRLIANGTQTPVIAVRFFDKDNRPIREGLIGQFSVDPPYVAQQNIDDLARQPLSGLDRGKPRYRVGKDGVALIELKPTTRTGVVTLRIPLQGREATLRPWLSPAQRDWIMVGLADGTLAHNTVSGNMASLSAAGIKRDTYTNGKVSFFAKGSIEGKWLLTLAYNSDKGAPEHNRLFQEIDPNAYYPVYGDKSVEGHDASSREKLYVRLERRQFYALFGDFHTGLTVTDLARYDRSLTGFKSESRGKHYSLNVFASQTNQVFVKDEIRGDGTSGLYHLRYSGLVVNSEKVTIETRDRYRPQIVLSSRVLTRNIDYDIDYDTGTLFFKQPVPSTDANFNPIYIVVDYETQSNNAKAWTYGGRGAVKFLHNKVELGATYVSQGQGNGSDTLKGVDATVDFDKATQLKLEYATSRAVNGQSKDAHLAELRHTSSKLDGSIYYRDREAGFGLGQQSGIGAGTSLLGLGGTYHVTDRLDIQAQAFKQTNLQTDAVRDVAKTGIKYDTTQFGASAGLQVARDIYSNSPDAISQQLTMGAHKAFLDDRLNLRISHDQSLANNANPNYPNRTVLGADYLLSPATSLFAEQEFTDGDQIQTRSTRIGITNRPWTGATVNTSLVQRSSDAGQRLFANAGLQQSWRITDKWSMDASLDSSTTLKGQGAVPFSTTLPPASGSTENFTAVSLGATYQSATWSWTSRVERRIADSEDKWGIYSASVGEPYQGLGLSARLQWFQTQDSNGVDSTQGDLRLGLVRRPIGRRWTVLNRTDLLVDRQTGGSNDLDSRKLVNNTLVNYRGDTFQVSTYYGLKYARDPTAYATYSGYTDSLGFELRKDLGRRWDIGVRSSALHSLNTRQYEYSYGPSVGFSPATNLWLSLGYNWAGYKDKDFSMAGYAAQGVYLRLRFKFDQNSVRDIAKWFNR